MTKDTVVEYGPFGYSVRFRGGGQVPTVLSGYFTSREMADREIEKYMSTRRKRKTSNARSSAEH